MREILFKAKRIDNGELVEGLPTVMWGQYHIINPNDENTAYPIDTETICQYTGLTAYWDDGDEKASVWEHDLLEVDYRGNKVIAEVKYECGMFILASDEFVDSYIPLFDLVQVEDIGWVDAKVIGNVFDNPELLEKAR